MRIHACVLLGLLAACGGGDPAGDDGTAVDAAPAIVDADPNDKAANCATEFTTNLDPGFGRLDGTIRAVVPPTNTTCALPNSDHLVVQIDVAGATYRAVVNVLSTGADPDVRLHELDGPLPAPAFADGWHPGLALDYASDLGVSDADFTPHAMAELVELVSAQLEVGAPVSVYSSTDGGRPSTHLVHRNPTDEDGAIVVDPTGTPHWLLFSFSDQAF